MELLVSSVNGNLDMLLPQMKIQSNAIVINQCNENGYEFLEQNGNKIQVYHFKERGVGLSRNNGLMRATDEIVMFADEDLVFVDEYADLVEQEFKNHPEADLIFFQCEICKERKTYDTKEFHRVHWYNNGRYGAAGMAVRTKRVRECNVWFSLLFGGGAKYSNGEDSLFIQECMKKGMKAYASPVVIGKELERESTWFQGYTEKFFFDRGVLYHYLYGKLAYLFAIRFLKKHKRTMCNTISYEQALYHMSQGMKQR